VDIFIQEKEEIPNEEDDSHEYGDESNSNGTAFDWEATTA